MSRHRPPPAQRRSRHSDPSPRPRQPKPSASQPDTSRWFAFRSTAFVPSSEGAAEVRSALLDLCRPGPRAAWPCEAGAAGIGTNGAARWDVGRCFRSDQFLVTRFALASSLRPTRTGGSFAISPERAKAELPQAFLAGDRVRVGRLAMGGHSLTSDPLSQSCYCVETSMV